MKQWISVEDGLPQMDPSGWSDEVLTWDGSDYHLAQVTEDGEWADTDGPLRGVTHWTELEPPEEEEL